MRTSDGHVTHYEGQMYGSCASLTCRHEPTSCSCAPPPPCLVCSTLRTVTRSADPHEHPERNGVQQKMNQSWVLSYQVVRRSVCVIIFALLCFALLCSSSWGTDPQSTRPYNTHMFRAQKRIGWHHACMCCSEPPLSPSSFFLLFLIRRVAFGQGNHEVGSRSCAGVGNASMRRRDCRFGLLPHLQQFVTAKIR